MKIESKPYSLALLAAAAATLATTPPPLAAQVWESRNQLILPITWSAGMAFGAAVAVGDFNGDGRSDLAVGAPGRDIGGLVDVGFVEVFLGGATGVNPSYVLFYQGNAEGQRLGAAFAAGDLNNDGRDELVVAAPGVTVGGEAHAGMVTVWSRDAAGDWHDTYWTQNSAGVLGVAEAEDGFGATLAIGNFNGDAYGDLVIGVPNEAIGAVAQAGAVHVLYGSANGLTATGNQLWYRSGGGVTGTAGTYAALGGALATGNFDGDYFGDLAIGIPGDHVLGDGAQDGSVVVLFGTGGGLAGADQQRVDRETLGDFDAGDFNSRFGSALAAGDLDPTTSCLDGATCADDLVVGAKNATADSLGSAGLAYVVFGSWAGEGLEVDGHLELLQTFTGDSDSEVGDRFATSAAVGAFSPGPRRHLVLGTPDEARHGAPHAGIVQVGIDVDAFYDTTFNAEGQLLEQRTGLASAPQLQSSGFGTALATGDFDGDGWGDLAVGVPGYHIQGVGSVGAVQILYGALFADGFEISNANNWSW
jgi:hypothetical protein